MTPFFKAILSTVFFLVPSIFAAATDWPKAGDCAVIDGPANLSTSPKGKILRRIINESTMYVTEREGEWLHVSSTVISADKKMGCYGADPSTRVREGWIHQSNFKRASWEKLMTLDPLGAFENERRKTLRPHFRVSLKKACRCGKFGQPHHDTGTYSLIDHPQGHLLGTDCSINEKIASCTTEMGVYSETDTCPLSCTQVKEAIPLTTAERDGAYAVRAKEILVALKKQTSPEWLTEIQKRYPGWLPLLLVNPKRDTPYVFELLFRESFGVFEFEFKKQIKKRKVFVFFEDLARAKAAEATIAFDGSDGIEFRRFPFNLKSSEDAEYSPGICIGIRPDFVGIFAYHSENEFWPPIAGFNLREPSPLKLNEEEWMKKMKFAHEHSGGSRACQGPGLMHFSSNQ